MSDLVLKGLPERYSAREALELLGYNQWAKFEAALERAYVACRSIGEDPTVHYCWVEVPRSDGRPGKPACDVVMTTVGVQQLVSVSDITKPEVQRMRGLLHAMELEHRARAAAAVRSALVQAAKPNVVVRDNDDSWYGRHRRLVCEHVRELNKDYPGHFTVFSEIHLQADMIEEQLLRHVIETSGRDRPDVSVGLRWARYREGRVAGAGYKRPTIALRNLDAGTAGYAPVYNQACVYPDDELKLFRKWFHEIYMPEALADYLSDKFGACHHQLTLASAADAACLAVTSKRARLTPRVRLALTAAGGFVPAVGDKAPGALARAPGAAKRLPPLKKSKRLPAVK